MTHPADIAAQGASPSRGLFNRDRMPALHLDAKPVIDCSHVYKSFNRRVVGGGYTTFKTQLVQWLQPKKYKEELTRLRLDVLKDLDFVIRPRETVGIIGQNGAGKSTLLKLLTGIYRPTKGSIQHRGRISALLELGAGFHPEFSGRENIYMNGMILGLSRKELRLREEDIIDFAELRDFIDAPVRTYSSGMYMRLAFAIAVNVDPDILIIDEILSVGDEHFQHKSKAKIDEFKEKGTAIVLVTHDLGTVERWCTRAIWLEKGHIAADGEPRYVVGKYRAVVAEKENAARIASAPPAEPKAPSPVPNPEAATAPAVENHKRWGDGRVKIRRFAFLNADGKATTLLHSQKPFCVEIEYETTETLTDVNVGIGFRMTENQWIWGSNTQIERVAVPQLSGVGVIRCTFAASGIMGRNVFVDLAFESIEHAPHDFWIDATIVEFEHPGGQIGCVSLSTTWDFSKAEN